MECTEYARAREGCALQIAIRDRLSLHFVPWGRIGFRTMILSPHILRTSFHTWDPYIHTHTSIHTHTHITHTHTPPSSTHTHTHPPTHITHTPPSSTLTAIPQGYPRITHTHTLPSSTLTTPHTPPPHRAILAASDERCRGAAAVCTVSFDPVPIICSACQRERYSPPHMI